MLSNNDIDDIIDYEKDHLKTCRSAGFMVQASRDAKIIEALEELKETRKQKGEENEKSTFGNGYRRRIHCMF